MLLAGIEFHYQIALLYSSAGMQKMGDLQRTPADRRGRQHFRMAGAQLSRDVNLHVKSAALHSSSGNVVLRSWGRGAGPRRPHANYSAENHCYNRPRDGTPGSHIDCIYSFKVGSFSATCSPGLTPLATMILSPLLRPT